MYPTDLDDAERAHAAQRLRAMAEDFARQGILRDRALRTAFETTWRHPYVPAYYPHLNVDARPVLCLGAQRSEWLEAVYSDVTLITKVARIPLSPALRPASYNEPTSSSTLPAVVVDMLEQLELRDGHRVLEIGTGTGYNAALLCARLGDHAVTSLDVDDELVALARERLAANGHRPTVAAVDGTGGFPDRAPYDRVIATCAVRAVPPAWMEQAAPGAVILADLHGPLGGTLVRLEVDGAGGASGPFLRAGYGFMPLRSTGDAAEPHQAALVEDTPTTGWTDLDPTMLADGGAFAFCAQWHLPDVDVSRGLDPDGRPVTHLRAADGGHADIALHTDTDTDSGVRGHRTWERGSAGILDRLRDAREFWCAHDRPGPERFGLTVSPAGQHVWFDTPDGPRWPLAATGSAANPG